jgi:hypothetical protein
MIEDYSEEYIFFYIDGRIIYRLIHHHLLRRIPISLNDINFAFFALL